MFFVTLEEARSLVEPGLVEYVEYSVTWCRPPTKPASHENVRSTMRDAPSRA